MEAFQMMPWEKLRLLDLFSGIGGFTVGLERTCFQTIQFCEISPFCREILKERFPHVPVAEDVRQLVPMECDAISAGFPCQDASVANQTGLGIEGPRTGLWKEVKRLAAAIRPRVIVLENVPNLLNRGFETVLRDLAEIGYDAEWDCVSASSFGAPHKRERIWVIAYPSGTRGTRLVTSEDFSIAGPWRWNGQADLQSVANAPFQRSNRWPEPLLRRVDDGLLGRVDRLHAIGNSIVPQIAEAIGRAIMREYFPTT